MTLLVSKRLGINIPPNISLVNVSPDIEEEFNPNVLHTRSKAHNSLSGPRMLARDRLKLPPAPRAPPNLVFPDRQSKRRLTRNQRNRYSKLQQQQENANSLENNSHYLLTPHSRDNTPGSPSLSRTHSPVRLKSPTTPTWETLNSILIDDSDQQQHSNRRRNSRLELLRQKSSSVSRKSTSNDTNSYQKPEVRSPNKSAVSIRHLSSTPISADEEDNEAETATEAEVDYLAPPVTLTEGQEDARLYKRGRSASVQIQHDTNTLRKTVGIISSALAKKREQKMKRLGIQDKVENKSDVAEALTRKVSMGWYAKSMASKRLSPFGKSHTDALTEITPLQRFRRAARKVKNLVHVCQVCKDLTLREVSAEDWFAQMESIIDSSDEILAKPQGPSHVRPFITFVQDKEKKALVKLTFDKSLFARERRADYLLTMPLRELLRKSPNERSIEEENEVLMFMKRATPPFNEYSIEMQRKLIKCLHYDKYEKDRVICKTGQIADGVYFILSGTLVEQTDEHKKGLREMKPGERFGEEDIVCGCPRRATVLTHSEVELMTIHRLDYRAIVHMADDSNDPKYLEICRGDIVFRNFPMRKLIENPGVWSVLSYKYGRLMVKDSNDMEWIYIIKSGEAKIIKHLSVGKIDMAQRRKKVQKIIDDDDPHLMQKKMINFIAERHYVRSEYRLGEYHPPISSNRSSTRVIKSAPVNRSKDRYNSSIKNNTFFLHQQNRPVTMGTSRVPISELSSTPRQQLQISANNGISATDDEFLAEKSANNQGTASAAVTRLHVPPLDMTNEDFQNEADLDMETGRTSQGKGNITIAEEHQILNDPHSSHQNMKAKKAHAYINTSNLKDSFPLQNLPPIYGESKTSLNQKANEKKKLVAVPPFVQLESLHSGKVFGLRSCLDPNERGPSASLISGGCEVLQINKKFFMKHVDDAILGLIKVQYKAFPTEESLLDRLDNNFQWAEYKQKAVNEYLVKKGRMSKEESKNIEIQIGAL